MFTIDSILSEFNSAKITRVPSAFPEAQLETALENLTVTINLPDPVNPELPTEIWVGFDSNPDDDNETERLRQQFAEALRGTRIALCLTRPDAELPTYLLPGHLCESDIQFALMPHDLDEVYVFSLLRID